MRKLSLILLLCIGLALTACGGSDNSSQVQNQQAQISALQAQLADVQAQLSAAQAQSKTDEAGINTAVASLTGLQTSLAQLAALGGETAAQKTALKAASNQVLVLQALADSLTATG